MKVKSTGLGKTQLTAHFDGFTAKEGGEPSAVLIITSTEPVHWHIECDLGGSDLRQFAGQVLRPSMIWHLIKLLARGGDARGFVMEKEGGRRSDKQRVSRAPQPTPTPQPTPSPTLASRPATPEVTAAATATVAPAATQSPAAFTEAATPELLAAVTAAAAAPRSARPADADAAAGRPEASGTSASSHRDERERRRAERRRQREEAAQQYVTAG